MNRNFKTERAALWTAYSLRRSSATAKLRAAIFDLRAEAERAAQADLETTQAAVLALDREADLARSNAAFDRDEARVRAAEAKEQAKQDKLDAQEREREQRRRNQQEHAKQAEERREFEIMERDRLAKIAREQADADRIAEEAERARNPREKLPEDYVIREAYRRQLEAPIDPEKLAIYKKLAGEGMAAHAAERAKAGRQADPDTIREICANARRVAGLPETQ